MTDLLNLTNAERIEAARPDGLGYMEAHILGELMYVPRFGDSLRVPDSQGWWQYHPRNSFVVDGIRYSRTQEYCERPMIQLLADLLDATGARMRYDNPPSEYELDCWMTGEGL